ncbi:MAG: class I SAM-dependent methyltransferase [Legionellaceae bacterium]|nr:class I SAM-dependent methyltransferase [Legionellaceae bacterium]
MLRTNLQKLSNKKICFFTPKEVNYPAILDGKLDYNEAFSAFLKATDQKAHTAGIVENFISELNKKSAFLSPEKALKVADMGCADSSACLGFLQNIPCPEGIQYTGVDINDQFLESADTKLSNTPSIKKHTLFKGDILLDDISFIPQEELHSFDLVFISHLAYYLQNETLALQFVKNTRELLNQNGMVIFLHEDSTHHYRSTYNKNYKNANAPEILRRSAKNILNNDSQFNEVQFGSQLTFEPMTDNLWEAMKNPASYKKYAHLPHFVDNLNKMAFITQCDLVTLFEDGSLTKFVEEIKFALTNNNHCFELITTMQILVTPENNNTKNIQAALITAKDKYASDKRDLVQPNAELPLCYI